MLRSYCPLATSSARMVLPSSPALWASSWLWTLRASVESFNCASSARRLCTSFWASSNRDFGTKAQPGTRRVVPRTTRAAARGGRGRSTMTFRLLSGRRMPPLGERKAPSRGRSDSTAPGAGSRLLEHTGDLVDQARSRTRPLELVEVPDQVDREDHRDEDQE